MSESVGGELVGDGRFPSPGSERAAALGCRCPSAVNSEGQGNAQLSEIGMGQRWVYDAGCKVHEIDETLHVAHVTGHPRWLVLVARGEE